MSLNSISGSGLGGNAGIGLGLLSLSLIHNPLYDFQPLYHEGH
jgi:hypothetical protein